MNGTTIPTVPIMLNTYYPPNQPTPKRCYALGQALRQAIESWLSAKRVAVIASGGLSHFVIDEELDHQIITAMQNKDAATLTLSARSVKTRGIRDPQLDRHGWRCRASEDAAH